MSSRKKRSRKYKIKQKKDERKTWWMRNTKKTFERDQVFQNTEVKERSKKGRQD